MTSAIFGEKYLSKVGARFNSGDEARHAAERLSSEGSIDASHISVVEPRDPALDRKLEPETRGVGRTLAKSHATLGITGLVVGLVAAFILTITGITVFSWNPLYTYIVLAFFGAIAGLLIGGLFALRPDHDRLITWVKEGSRTGRWFLLVHAQDHDEEKRAKKALESMSNDVVATF
jgi:hypothetical protein